MARNVAILFLVFTYGSCMEMRETVERTVMVRTTGSDLQPAATGYIYKKESDGPVSVTKMGETEVIEHFSKLYGKSEAYKVPAPVPVGPFHASDDEDKAASHASEEIVKPVTEEEQADDSIDGIANEDYDKMFKEYAKKYGNYKKDYDRYLHGLGHYDHDIYHGYDNEKGFGTKGYKGHGAKDFEGEGLQHQYEKGGAGDYHSEKHAGYIISKDGGQKHRYGETDDHGKHYAYGNGYKGDGKGHKTGHNKGLAHDGFHKVFDKDEYKKLYDFYHGDTNEEEHNKYADEHKDRGSDNGGYKKGESYKSGHNESGFKKGGNVANESGDQQEGGHSSEKDEQSGQQNHRDFGVKGEHYAGKSYGYNIKH